MDRLYTIASEKAWSAAIPQQVEEELARSGRRLIAVMACALGMFVGLTSLSFVAMTVGPNNPWLVLALVPELLGIVAMVALFAMGVITIPNRRFVWLQVRGHGVEIGEFFTHLEPGRHHLLEGSDTRGIVRPTPKATRFVAFEDLDDIDVHERRVILTTSEDPIEVDCTELEPADVQTLLDTLRAHLGRYRDGVSDSPDEARDRRAQLQSLRSPSA